MAKSKQTGVRFDEELLQLFKDAGMEITHQKALSLYEEFFKQEIESKLSTKYFKKIYIYKLINPISNKVFYVGRTGFDLQKRLKQHIHNIKTALSDSNINNRKVEVIKEILAANKMPIIELIEVVTPYADGDYNGNHPRETHWIAFYLKEGHPLINKINKDITEKVKAELEPEKPKLTRADTPKGLNWMEKLVWRNENGVV